MSYVKSVPLKKLFQYTQDDDEVVLLASENEQPEDADLFKDVVLNSLQGEAGDPTRIGAEYMPESLPSLLVELDTVPADTVLPANTIGASPDGELVIGDGVTSGGVVVNSTARKRFVGTELMTEAELDSTVVRQVGTFAIPAAKAVAGTVIRLRGRYYETTDAVVGGSRGMGIAGNGVVPININQCVAASSSYGRAGKPTTVVFDFAVTLYDNTTNLGATVVSSVIGVWNSFPATIDAGNFGITPTGTPTYTEIPVTQEVSPTVPVVAAWSVAKDTDNELGVYYIATTNSASTGAKVTYDFEVSFD